MPRRYNNNRHYGNSNNAVMRREGKKVRGRSAQSVYNNILKGASTTAKIAMTAAQVAKMAGLINTEFKFKDTVNTAGVGVKSSGLNTVILLNGLQKGTNADQRDGRSARVKSVYSNIALDYNATSIAQKIRLLWVIDKQPNAAAFGLADLFAQPTTPVYSARNLSNKKRFVILKEKFLQPQDTGGKKTIQIKPYYKDLDMHTAYNDQNNGTIADIETNALYFVAVSDTAINDATIRWVHRIRFLDN